MVGKRVSRCVVAVLAVAFITSALVVLISPPVGAALWTQTTDTDFNSANVLNGVDVIGIGAPAYLQLMKDNYNWFFKNPSSPPAARLGHAGAFDTLNGRTLIFGGIDQSGIFRNDLWAYYSGNNTWLQIQASAPPSARWGAGMAFDTTNNVAVLYGGWDNIGQNYETWEYNAVSGAWTNTTKPIKPTQLSSNPLTFDSTANRVILAAQGKLTWETWEYAVTTDTWTRRTGSTPPQNRASHMLAYYPELSRTVMYGGADFLTVWDETWEYDYSTDKWTNQTGNTGGSSPGGLTGFGFAYRNAYADVMLWGGQSSSGYSTDTWRYWYNAGLRYWIVVSTSGFPSARRDFSMAYDRGTTSTVVFGGKDPIGTKLGDTWAYEAGWRAFGFIKSSVFDSLHANTMWKYIFWNQTPGDVPAGSQIRFQVATSNVADPNDPSWSFVGPDGTSSTYYTSPGAAIWAPMPARYIMYLGQLICTGCSDSPYLEDVSIDYTWGSANPYVISKGPQTPPYFSVPIASNIWINFSEPMDKAQVTVELNPPDVTLVKTWFDSDTRLVLTHPGGDLNYCTQYRPRITQAVDMEGQSMAGLPYEWVFVTVCPDPYIASTSPLANDVDVPLASPIWVNFSKSMNISSVLVDATPPLTSPNKVWSNGDKTLRVNHAGYIDCQLYNVEVTGKDINDKALIPGPVPNPWQFTTHCTNPQVLSTDPTNAQIEVPVTKAVVITFSHQMNTGTVNAVFTPSITLSESWNSPLDTILTLNHPPNFLACQVYNVNVTGMDTGGNDLQGGYYAFWFFTTCGGAPYIMLTQPVHAAKDIGLNQNISITFSESMVPGSIVYTIMPDDWTWVVNWGMMNMNMNFDHVTPFSTCTRYYVNITDGVDQNEGKHLVPGPVPNRFYFDTVCTNPSVINIVPPDGATDVPNDTNIAITFNKPMNEMTFVYTIRPLITLLESWTGGSTVFHLDHGPLFQDCKRYDLTIVFAEDKGGYPLVGDRDFNFTTFCPGVNPWITHTDPFNRESNVELTRIINVSFSEPIDPLSFSAVISPNIPLGPQWAPDLTWVQLTHAPFLEGRTYNVTIQACDFDGDCLVPGPVPNPWEFTTLSVFPYITSTDPAHLQQNVAVTKEIRVQFSEAMDRLSVNWIVQPLGISFTSQWTNGDKTLTLMHSTSFSICTEYTVTITGSDPDGNNIIPGPVPNPWRFTTTCTPGAPGGLQVSRQGNDIRLTWRVPPMASGYHVYETGNRFTPWSLWAQLANITATSYTALGHNSDGLTHFYIVRAYNDTSWLEGPNSTMGVKLHKQFSYSPLGGNNQWFSLPYNTIYKKASDIAGELGPSKVTVIAKWDPARQQSILYYYLRGKWRGPDFPINAGDGLWVSVVSAFSWSINGTDSARQLQFNLNSPPKTNYFWISLPYTNSYVDAAAISTELTSGLITEVGRYNPATGGIERWYWTVTIWTGVNFAIMPGEGIYLVIKATFNWTPRLITPEEP